MTLSAGTRLGPYEIDSLLGAGGMGEVYRARDTRLLRDVAVKILPSSLSQDQERLEQFQLEARAASALTHPGIVAVHDVGTHQGSPYVVSELLDGETLAQRIGGAPLPVRKAVDYARQIAEALAAAHDKGIVHRDLKPDNVVVTRDGRVKILDFGLARLVSGDGAEAQNEAATTGRVLGTVGYMSPEQVRGQPADARADIFSFGAILYEMLTGRRAFRGETSVETMNGILKEDPPQLEAVKGALPPGLERIVWHCLEKAREERFQSARDLAFDLETLSNLSGPGAVLGGVRGPRRRRLALGAMGLAGVAAGGLAVLALRSPPVQAIPSLQRLTFRRGVIEHARFAPDGQTLVYGASWGGRPVEPFASRPESPESRPLGFPGAEILSMSRGAEMALSLGRRRVGTFVSQGTLARAPLAGGAPREVLEDVQQAEWSPDGRALAVVRTVGGRNRLEFPQGRVLYETAGWISDPRFSPAGDRIAFLDHPVWGDDGGNVAVVDLAGQARILSQRWISIEGLAFHPGRGEIWFTGTRLGSARAIHAVSLDGRERPVSRMAGALTLHDIAADGRALVSHDVLRREMLALPPGAGQERDLSWLDYCFPSDLSDDGSTVFFAENGEGGGPGYATYLRGTDGSAAVRLSEGAAMALSPDGRSALANTNYTSAAQQLLLIPTGTGQARTLAKTSVNAQAATFLPDGRRILVLGSEAGHAARTYLLDLDTGGPLRPLSPEGTSFALGARPVSPDGRLVLLRDAGGFSLYPVEGGEARRVPGLGPADQLIRWSGDARAVFVYKPGEIPARIERMDLASGKREPWRQLAPADTAGVLAVTPVLLTPDGRSYVYGFRRVLSDLYLVEGLR